MTLEQRGEVRGAIQTSHVCAHLACLLAHNGDSNARHYAVRSVRWYREAVESLSDLQARDPYTVSRILAEFA
jgi:hypothetical protein